MSSLDPRLEELARAPVLLVASDYDGTIAPIVDDPEQARPYREAIVALRTLADLAHTHVAVISGRALRDLARFTGLPEDVHLVGSHGSEFDTGFTRRLAPAQLQLRARVQAELEEIARRGAGFRLELKPSGVAFHYRNASEEAGEQALRKVLEGPAVIEGVHTKQGKKVVELSVVSTDKGAALRTIRQRVGASAVLFLGDDVTDEDAFATLTAKDVGIKVGPGETRASERVEGPEEVARVLARLCELREAWLAGGRATPLQRLSMLSDLRTAALLDERARVVWMCAPRVDSPALFAELLGGPASGYFSVAPADGSRPLEQRWEGDSLVLRTRWASFSTLDFLDASAGRPLQRAGRSDLVRLVEGSGRVRIELSPRLDFGRQQTRLVLREGGVEVEHSPDPIVLHAPGVEWTLVEEGEHQLARAEVRLGEAPLALVLRYGSGSLRPSSVPVVERMRATVAWWSAWAEALRLPAVRPELIKRSALCLRGLAHGPTGAILAAATTSLPEQAGGVRNWDYRFCWLRDAALSASALVRLGSTGEAMALLGWLLGVLDRCESPERLHPLYTVGGHEPAPEAEIGGLPGYRGSRPVRIGNAAARQVQLDVFGPIVDLVAHLAAVDAPLSSEHWRLVEAMVLAVERRWHEPDNGIWEIRRRPRHHVHSKVMCWLAVDRAMTISEHFRDRPQEAWRRLRDAIAEDVLAHGYKAELGAFTAAYDDVDLDAAALWVGLSGLLPADDPRFVGTVAAVERGLLEGPVVYRYRSDDGLPGTEGGFLFCASWLVEAYLRMGRSDAARALFARLASLAGPTGTLTEQHDPVSDEALGNLPQAYSHIGLIENAVRLGELGLEA